MPKYFSGNLSAGNKLFRTPAERRADKLAKQTRQNLKTSQSALDQSGKNTKKSFADKDKKSLPHVDTNNKNYQAYENATTDTEKLRYGKAYLRDTFSNKYDDFLDLIENSIVDEKMGLSPDTNPFVRFMDKNDHINNFNGKKDLSKVVFDTIEKDPDITNDNKSFIYNKGVQERINSLSGKDLDKFVLLVTILSDSDSSDRYFNNISDQERLDLIDDIASQSNYRDMKKVVDDKQQSDKEAADQEEEARKQIKDAEEKAKQHQKGVPVEKLDSSEFDFLNKAMTTMFRGKYKPQDLFKIQDENVALPLGGLSSEEQAKLDVVLKKLGVDNGLKDFSTQTILLK